MDKKCSKCGGELIEGALLDDFSFHSVIYSPMDELIKIKKVKTGVICDACTQLHSATPGGHGCGLRTATGRSQNGQLAV